MPATLIRALLLIAGIESNHGQTLDGHVVFAGRMPPEVALDV